jgi:hypothetical protein
MTDSKSKSSPEDILVGGQAVIEGVMMRTPYASAVAVRRMICRSASICDPWHECVEFLHQRCYGG